MATVHFQALWNTTSCKPNTKVNRIQTVTLKGNEMFHTSMKMGTKRSHTSAASMTEVNDIPGTKARQNIPTKKLLVDPFRQGIVTEGGVGYRQTVVIRSYEVGANKTATLESILNLLQETALNHIWVSGLLGDGFGATHGMVRNNLIWVVSRMQVQVEDYPIWGEVMEINTWVGASGKNGMRRDWLIRSHATGQVFVRATSTWVMMNQQTGRLSKMPEEVRAEIAPWFIEKKAVQEEIPEKINKLDKSAKYINSNLKTIPCNLLENYQLSSMTLEYRRDCGSSDVVQSLCEPEDKNSEERIEDSVSVLNGESLKSAFQQVIAKIHSSPANFTRECKRRRDCSRKNHMEKKALNCAVCRVC